MNAIATSEKQKILIVDPPKDKYVINVFLDFVEELIEHNCEVCFLFWNNVGNYLRYVFYFENVYFRQIDINDKDKSLINDIYINLDSAPTLVKEAIELYANVIITDIKPISVGLWNGNRFSNKIFSKVCQTNGVSISYFEQGVFPGSLSIDSKGTNANSHFYEDCFFPKVQTRLATSFIESFLKKGETVINSSFRPVDCEIERNDLISIPEKIIFFPLQLDADCNIVFHSKYFKTMKEVVLLINSSLDVMENIKLVVRVHPKADDYKVINEWLKNLGVLVVNNIPLNECLERSDFVIVLNSTVGLEAIIRQKKVFALAKSIYSNRGLTFDYNNDLSFNYQINEFFLNYKSPDKEIINQYIAYLISHYTYLSKEWCEAVDESMNVEFFENNKMLLLNSSILSSSNQMKIKDRSYEYEYTLFYGLSIREKNKLVSIKLISYDDCMDKFSQSLACDLSELRQIIDFLDCIEYKGMNYAEINEFKGLLSIKFRNLFNNSFKVYGVVLFSLYFELCSCGKYDMRGGYFFMSLIKSYTVFRVKKYLSYFLNKPV